MLLIFSSKQAFSRAQTVEQYLVMLLSWGGSVMLIFKIVHIPQAEMSGMNLSYECRRGNCISCAAKVQDGEKF